MDKTDKMQKQAGKEIGNLNRPILIEEIKIIAEDSRVQKKPGKGGHEKGIYHTLEEQIIPAAVPDCVCRHMQSAVFY